MNDRLYDAFEVCRLALNTGVPLEAALGLYPEMASELRAALEAWQAASTLSASLPEVSGIRVQRSRTRLLGRAAQLRGTARPRGLALRGLSRLSLAALSVLLVIVLGWGGLATASAQALPGDTLYRLKRVDENLRLGLAGTSKRSDLETEFAERRSEEVRTLLALGRVHEIEFTGVVRSQSGDIWDVDSVRVFVGPEAEVDAGIVPGVTVEVEGNTDDRGNVRAIEIHLAAYSWEGTVQTIGLQAWTVSGRVVSVDRATAIAPGIREGDRVLMLIDVLPGSVRARSILYLGPAGTESAPADSRSDEWEFEGLVQTIGTQAWIIAGQTLLIVPETELDRSLQVGSAARVKAQTTTQGRVIALEIARADGGGGEPDEDLEGESTADSSGEGEVEVGPISGEDSAPESSAGDSDNESPEDPEASTEESFTGEVTSISGSVWTIAGQQVWVDQDTEIRDAPDVGDSVRVDARLSDGRWVAEKIEKR
jgi:hypothetical protein